MITKKSPGALFIADPDFGKNFSVIKIDINLPGYGGRGRVHPDLIPFPDRVDEVVMVYTPENPNDFENMCLVRSQIDDLTNWTDDIWVNPVIKRNVNISWKNYHLADFCILYVPDLRQRWWTWYQPHSGLLGCQIALGLSDDGIRWSDEISSNPVMCSRDEGNQWEYKHLRAPSVLWNRYRERFEMFYDNLAEGWVKPIRICRAESKDGRKWVKRAVIYDPLQTSEQQHAFHPVVRYFAGYYWCWFPRYEDGLWLMYSKTGLTGDWSKPCQVLSIDLLGAKAVYRAGVLIDKKYKVHMMLSAMHENNIYKIHYLTSQLSKSSQKVYQAEGVMIRDYDFGGSIIGGVDV